MHPLYFPFEATSQAAGAQKRPQQLRLMRVAMACIPLLVLLVGSCRTSDLPAAAIPLEDPSHMRAVFFPGVGEDGKIPAAYLKRARMIVTAQPELISRMAPADVARVFGAPSAVRRDADASVWQYRAGACVLDLFFYGDPAAVAVSHSSVRARVGVEEAACFSALARGKRA